MDKISEDIKFTKEIIAVKGSITKSLININGEGLKEAKGLLSLIRWGWNCGTEAFGEGGIENYEKHVNNCDDCKKYLSNENISLYDLGIKIKNVNKFFNKL